MSQQVDAQPSHAGIGEDAPFAGWVPTPTGRLSFRRIGESSHPTQSIHANWREPGKDTRTIIAFQQRPLSDALLGIDFLRGTSGRYWFATSLQGGDPFGRAEEDKLNGVIWIISGHQRDTFHDDRLRIVRLIREMQERVTPEAGLRAEPSTSNQKSKFEDLVAKHAFARVGFRLLRTGEVYLGGAEYRLLRSNGSAPTTPWTPAVRREAQIFVNQAYSFLRDISHSHQHHPDSDDQMLILFERDAEDKRWREAVIHTLMGHVVRACRGLDAERLARAKGVLAYCEAFRNICVGCEKYNLFGERDYDMQAVKDSIDANLSERAALLNHDADRNQSVSRRHTFWFGVYAVFLALCQIVSQLYTDSLRSGIGTVYGDLGSTENIKIIVMLFPFIVVLLMATPLVIVGKEWVLGAIGIFRPAPWIPNIVLRLIYVAPSKNKLALFLASTGAAIIALCYFYIASFFK